MKAFYCLFVSSKARVVSLTTLLPVFYAFNSLQMAGHMHGTYREGGEERYRDTEGERGRDGRESEDKRDQLLLNECLMKLLTSDTIHRHSTHTKHVRSELN